MSYWYLCDPSTLGLRQEDWKHRASLSYTLVLGIQSWVPAKLENEKRMCAQCAFSYMAVVRVS